MSALYDTAWNKIATVDIGYPDHNGISYDDSEALSAACEAVEQLLVEGDFADLLRAGPEESR